MTNFFAVNPPPAGTPVLALRTGANGAAGAKIFSRRVAPAASPALSELPATCAVESAARRQLCCYKRSMDELKTLPLYTGSAAEKDKLFAKQRLELKCRGELVRTYRERDRSRGDTQRLDRCWPRTSA